jgi:glycosyltransferase involved in cell wall biosynthesis
MSGGGAVTLVGVVDTGNPAAPSGGQSSFLSAILPEMRSDLVLIAGAAGLHDTSCVVGGRTIPTIPIAHAQGYRKRRLLPSRLTALVRLWLRKRSVRVSCDVLYVHSPELVLPFRSDQIPVVLHVHGNRSPLDHARYSWARMRLPRALYGLLMRLAFRRADALLVVDEEGAALCERFGGLAVRDACTVVPTAVSKEWFELAGASRTPEQADAKVVLFVGRLETGKGTGELLNVISAVLSAEPDARAVIAGDGSERIALERQADVLGLTSHVSFLGWVDARTLRVQMLSASVLFLPSLAEGMPVSVLEALAAGVPVVASRVGALPLLVVEGVNGHLVAGSGQDYADAVIDLLRRPVDRAVVSETVSHYSATRVAHRIDRILGQAAGLERAPNREAGVSPNGSPAQ